MLRHLRLNNIVLAERAEAEFASGLHAITGETGAGKSILIRALKLLAGERATPDLVRRGAPIGWVEAVFEPPPQSAVWQLLSDSGIAVDRENEDLLLRRELFSEGSHKSRGYINHQLVQKSLLERVAQELFLLVGQHDNRTLLHVDWHRHYLDNFAKITPETHAFEAKWNSFRDLQKRQQQLLAKKRERLRECETLRRELAELEAAQLQEGEEDLLFSEYSLLTQAQKRIQLAAEAAHLLQNERGILPQGYSCKKTLEKLGACDPSLQETILSFTHALLDIEESAYTLTQYQSRIEENPQRTEWLQTRLHLLDQLKRRYGPSLNDLIAYQREARHRLTALEGTEEAIDQLEQELLLLERELDNSAYALTRKRREAGHSLTNELSRELHELNMPHAQLEVVVEKKERSCYGEDHVEFFLKPNLGEKNIPLKTCASGGELSRLLLAFYQLMTEENDGLTLIFDEIDGNIGGETATTIGQKLAELGKKRQILCITHFPQVACHATHHLRVSKQCQEGRTLSTIQPLSQKSRHEELLRMAGGREKMTTREQTD